VKDGLHVEREDSLPGLLVVVVHGRAPCRAGVVDEDVEMVFACGDLIGETLAFDFGGEVRR
jgi:hypothetical protein